MGNDQWRQVWSESAQAPCIRAGQHSRGAQWIRCSQLSAELLPSHPVLVPPLLLLLLPLPSPSRSLLTSFSKLIAQKVLPQGLLLLQNSPAEPWGIPGPWKLREMIVVSDSCLNHDLGHLDGHNRESELPAMLQ